VKGRGVVDHDVVAASKEVLTIKSDAAIVEIKSDTKDMPV
jgi:hypothetical protein